MTKSPEPIQFSLRISCFYLCRPGLNSRIGLVCFVSNFLEFLGMTSLASRWITSTLALFFLGACPLLARSAEPTADKPLSVLFLGDKGHHDPAARAEQLIPVLEIRGINVTYSEAMSDLNPTTLAKYDALLIYANTEKIEPEQEKALLDYVENGGGFAPIHCASFCFLNSPKYIALVGAQFKSHGTGEFEVKNVAPEDPILKGLKPFRTWDETYTHHKFNETNRKLLQVRDEKGNDEPWTWTRSQGKGRVFTPRTVTINGPGGTPPSWT